MKERLQGRHQFRYVNKFTKNFVLGKAAVLDPKILTGRFC